MSRGEDIVNIKIGDPGPTSDIKQFRERQGEFEQQQKFKGDKADMGEPQISTPEKKPQNQELTQEQKQANQEFSSQRIFVEHVIRGLKIFRVAQERFRLRPATYEQIILAVCGLVRFRMGALVLPV